MDLNLVNRREFGPICLIVILYYDLSSDFLMTIGSEVSISSPNYATYYRPITNFLWTFQYDSNDDLLAPFHISFEEFVYLYSINSLTIGRGFDPDNSSATSISYGPSYFGYPRDILIEASVIFIEFKSDGIYNEGYFQLNVLLRNNTGIKLTLQTLKETSGRFVDFPI